MLFSSAFKATRPETGEDRLTSPFTAMQSGVVEGVLSID
jgi:hypothetical protein